MAATKWIGIGYFLPAQPSKARVFVWRRLKSIGAQIIKPGMAALPNNEDNTALFRELADKIDEFSGEAILIEFNFLTMDNDAALRHKFSDAAKKQYGDLMDNCNDILQEMEVATNLEEKSILEQRLLKTVTQYAKKHPKLSSTLGAQDLEKGMNEIYDALKSVPAELRAMLFRDKKK